MLGRRCCAGTPNGRLCPATPLRDQPYCFLHSPDHTAEAAEARRLGDLSGGPQHLMPA